MNIRNIKRSGLEVSNMNDNYVGASVLNVITESLYDNPMVVFREYVQNAVDSIYKNDDYLNKCEVRIIYKSNSLLFLDNGQGIIKKDFIKEMVSIGASGKRRQKNLGYKGIGRLSGVPYCKELVFINICDYKNKEIQIYKIDCNIYDKLKNREEFFSMDFKGLMEKIGCTLTDYKSYSDIVCDALSNNNELLEKTNTGFLVIMKDISAVLKEVISNVGFKRNLQWLLPVNFESELIKSDKKELFKDLLNDKSNPVKYCNIYYNDNQIFRPISKEMLRDYVCKCDFKYAVGFHSFSGSKIAIDKNNIFSGIRIYVDNMLLCDESELLRNLENFGLTEHTMNGLLQTVRGIGAMIYITDKVNICSNARRTFVEVTDEGTLMFLRLLNEFINIIYDARYALSKYVSSREKYINDIEKNNKLRNEALVCLQKLAQDKISLTAEEVTNFDDLDIIEKKRIIKRHIAQIVDNKIKEYLKSDVKNNTKLAYEDFVDWLYKHKN